MPEPVEDGLWLRFFQAVVYFTPQRRAVNYMSVLASPEYVSAGSKMTWTGVFDSANTTGWAAVDQAILFSNAYDAVSAVAAALKNNYDLIVERSDNGLNWTGGKGSITLYLRTDSDRGDGETDDGLTDIQGNVDDTFRAQGFPPVNSSITSYQRVSSNGSTENVNTGTPQKTVAQQQADENKNSSGSGLTGWWDKTVSNLEAGSIGIVIGGAVVIGLLIYLSVRKASPV